MSKKNLDHIIDVIYDWLVVCSEADPLLHFSGKYKMSNAMNFQPTGNRILVTGATGFIGRNLVENLVEHGADVTCLVRKNSDVSELEDWNCRLVTADMSDSAIDFEPIVARQDVVFHLAATTKVLSKSQYFETNVKGFDNFLAACQKSESAPTVVFVSSLAAVGPSSLSNPHSETEVCRPVSNYGESKAEAEQVARSYADRVPVSIVRPPIVLGPRDRTGLEMFSSIAKFGIHIVPGFRDQEVSVIHVDDLVTALRRVAERGSRLSSEDPAQGVYFAAAKERPTYRELGNLIGDALGKQRVVKIPVPRFAVKSLAGINSLIASITGKSQYLNFDKAREICAGSWSCSNQKICEELEFAPAFPLNTRLQQIVKWYRRHEWLPSQGSEANAPERSPSNLAR